MTAPRRIRVTEEPFKEDAWCFTCRARRDFVWFVYRVPGDTIEYCDPYGRVECIECRTEDSDLFPGRSREYED